MNTNNCATCDHKKRPDGGWCYMFRDEPQEVCMKHSERLLPGGPKLLGTPISQLSGRPGHTGFGAFSDIAASWGYD